MNTTLDTVSIQIESDAGNSVNNINNLAKSLETLKKAIKGGFSNINKLATGLENLSKSTKDLDKVITRISNINQVIEPLNKLNEIKTPTGLKNVVNNLEKLPEVFAKLDGTALDNIAKTSERLAQALQPLANRMSEISQGYSSLSQMENTYGGQTSSTNKKIKDQINWLGVLKKSVSAAVAPFKKLLSATLSLGKAGDKVFKNMTSKIKQMGLSLLGTRTIFTATRKAISEYVNMDQELSDSITNLWRALGAQLAPAIEGIMYLFKQFVRIIYSVIKAITGIDLIARANAKATAGWGKSADDALGSLQKFDDLNVVDFGKGSGDNELIDLEEIDLSPIQKIMDWIRKMKKEIEEAFDTGKWKGVGIALGEGLNEATNFLLTKLPEAVSKLSIVATEFANFLNGALETVEWENVGQLIVDAFKVIPDAISTFFSEINWEELGQSFSDVFKNADIGGLISSLLNIFGSLFTGLIDAAAGADWKVIGEKLGEIISSLFSTIGTIISNADWSAVGQAIKDVIIGINWGEVFASIGTLIGEVFNGLVEFISGLTGLDMENSEGLVNMIGVLGLLGAAIGLIIKRFADFKDNTKDVTAGGTDMSKMFDGIGKGVEDLGKKLGNAAMIISILGGVALVITSITELIKSFADSGVTLGEGIGIILTALLGIAGAFAVIAATTQLLNVDDLLTMITIFAGLAAVFLTVSVLMDTLGKNGQSLGDVLGVLLSVVGAIVIVMGAVALIGPAMTAGLLPFAAVIALIVATLAVMALTIPPILDACGRFVEKIAPLIIAVLQIIHMAIVDIIYAIGTVLPPIIEAVGGIFQTIFGGVALIIETVGNVIIKIMETSARLTTQVLQSILNFINRLGPAINNFVDNAIKAVTKLINFLVSGIEYLVNRLVIDGINGIINGINKIGKYVGFTIPVVAQFRIPRFVPQLETGTNEVPYDGMLAVLHQGEAVVPKKYNPALGGGNSQEMLDRFDRLIFLMENQEQTTNVYVGNKKLYQEQKKYNSRQYNKYGTLEI